MVAYKKKYLKHFGYGIDDYVPCEICHSPGVDIHHINYKSRGGVDEIKNLMALCRYHHDLAHEEVLSQEHLQEIHDNFLKI